VWDGTNVYLVQADEEWSWSGHNPVEEHESRLYEVANFNPRCLQRVTLENGARFGKVANALLYLRLGMQTAPLFLLQDRAVIEQLVAGTPPAALSEDISALVRNSLVIRTDLATDDLHAKQLLPRTHEVRNAEMALDWLISTSRKLEQLNLEFAFIFHNFIPALAAAFSYARPGERRVQIESLWGLPEGLYYNSHDKHVVDTGEANAAKLAFEKADKFFVSTTPSGNWETLTVAPPFDWRVSLNPDDCRRIAYESRRIAETEMRALSIMWFVGVPSTLTTSGVTCIPWYHEPFDILKAISTITTRKKTTYDRSFTVSTAEDVETLRNDTSKTRFARIRIQPRDESLLRKKETLQIIGLLAKEHGSIIVLEGGVLSHAYYQLSSTGAVVEVVHPFIGFDERQDYNKLVRDRVPEIIVERGENLTVAQLSGDSHVTALREKLIEEGFELLDARDLQSIVGEIADVQEILDCLKEKLGISPERAKEEQTLKRHERGSFSKGIVLVETEHNIPTSTPSQPEQPTLFGLEPESKAIKLVDESEFQKRKAVIEKSRDRRTEGGRVEIKANFSVAVTKGEFVETTVEQPISATDLRMVLGELKAKRRGSRIEFELSVTVEDRQLELFSNYSGQGF
jgi:predicted house-cleaning noncanonical NTP pyrophosphatase (MazG superfamily)